MAIVFFTNAPKVNKKIFVYHLIFNFKYTGKCFVINLNDLLAIVPLREKGRKLAD